MSRLGPPVYLDSQPSETELVRFSDGRVMRDVDTVMPPDQIEQIRQGYRCINCGEPQEEPFPEVCGQTLPDGVTLACKFQIRDKQAEVFAWKYGGEVDMDVNDRKLVDEAERLGELDAYESRTGIILPHHVKFPSGPL